MIAGGPVKASSLGLRFLLDLQGLHGFWMPGESMNCALSHRAPSFPSSPNLGCCLACPFLCLLRKVGGNCRMSDALTLLLLNTRNPESKRHFLYTNGRRTKFTG